MKTEIQNLEKENKRFYFENMERDFHKTNNSEIISIVQSAISDRENVFISKKIFNSRRFYLNALINNTQKVK